MGLMDRLKQLIYLRLTPQGNRAGSTTPADDDLDDDYSRDIARALANAYRHPVVCIARPLAYHARLAAPLTSSSGK